MLNFYLLGHKYVWIKNKNELAKCQVLTENFPMACVFTYKEYFTGRFHHLHSKIVVGLFHILKLSTTNKYRVLFSCAQAAICNVELRGNTKCDGNFGFSLFNKHAYFYLYIGWSKKLWIDPLNLYRSLQAKIIRRNQKKLAVEVVIYRIFKFTRFPATNHTTR